MDTGNDTQPQSENQHYLDSPDWNKEVNAAAKWWADLLRSNASPRVDLGARTENDLMTEISLSMFTKSAPDFDETTVLMFESALKFMIADKVAQRGCWRRSEPHWGGLSRIINVDYHAPDILKDAAMLAGIKNIDRYLPIKTVMWIDPGSVRVRKGYGAQTQVVYAAASNGDGEARDE